MVRPTRKIGIIVISAFVTLVMFQTILRLTKKSPQPQWSSVRPDDFPEILVAPEFAEQISYFEPTHLTLGVYTIRFSVNEGYPAEKILSFVEKHLTAHGWRRLEHSLLNPKLEFIPYRKWTPDRIKSGEIVWEYSEDWLNESDESMNVSLCIRTNQTVSDDARPSVTELEEMLSETDNLIVVLTLSNANSWVHSFVLKYKELYPEEFDTTFRL